MADSTQALTHIIKILQPLTSEERHRNIHAALTFLGEQPHAVAVKQPDAHQQHSVDGLQPPDIVARMKQYGITYEQAERVFDFRADGTFSILDVPGKGKREQSLNMYVLTGLGTFLATGERKFADDLARTNCDTHSCLDSPNHAKTLGGKHPEFNGDKASGWSITVPGIRRGAQLVKEVAEAATKA
jgi:hypothetical protein